MQEENTCAWVVRLITPNQVEADAEVKEWIAKGYGTHFSKYKKQVMIKRGGPQKKLYVVRTRTKK